MRPPGDAAQDLPGDVLAALDRRLGDLRQRRALAAGGQGDVADGEHLRVTRQREVGLDDEPAAAPVGVPSAAASGSAVTPVAQTIVPAPMLEPSLRCTRPASTADTPHAEDHLDVAPLERSTGAAATTPP